MSTDDAARGIHRRLPINVTANLVNRFNEAVDVGSPSECWNWKRALRSGYGAIQHEGRVYSAHRVAFAIANGRDARGLVLHSCDNRACCNPSHLSEGTARQNANEAKQRNRFVFTRGEDHPSSLLTNETVRYIRDEIAKGVSQRRVAATLGVSRRTVRNVLNGTRWKHVA